jgi:hypothetical protein
MRIAKQPTEAIARETVLEVHTEGSPKAMRDLSLIMILPNFRIAEETAEEHVSRGGGGENSTSPREVDGLFINRLLLVE